MFIKTRIVLGSEIELACLACTRPWAPGRKAGVSDACLVTIALWSERQEDLDSKASLSYEASSKQAWAVPYLASKQQRKSVLRT